jgi:hypothetical protein
LLKYLKNEKEQKKCKELLPALKQQAKTFEDKLNLHIKSKECDFWEKIVNVPAAKADTVKKRDQVKADYKKLETNAAADKDKKDSEKKAEEAEVWGF